MPQVIVIGVINQLCYQGGPALYDWILLGYPPVIKAMENGTFIGGVPIKTPMYRGFAAAMFDYQRALKTNGCRFLLFF